MTERAGDIGEHVRSEAVGRGEPAYESGISGFRGQLAMKRAISSWPGSIARPVRAASASPNDAEPSAETADPA